MLQANNGAANNAMKAGKLKNILYLALDAWHLCKNENRNGVVLWTKKGHPQAAQ